MKFRPIFTDRQAMPVWEITGAAIPEIVDRATSTDTNWTSADVVYNLPISKNPGKYLYTGEEMLKMNFKSIMDPIYNFLLTQKDYDFWNSWPTSQFQEVLAKHPHGGSMDIWKILPNTSHGAHVDNLFIMGTVIVNIADNAEGSGTKYYDKRGQGDDDTWVPIYEAPVKRGTGVLHINTSSTLHQGHNNSDQDRYIAYTNIMSPTGH